MAISFIDSNLFFGNLPKQYHIMDVPEGGIWANCLDIEFDPARPVSRELHRLKLYNVATLAQKIQLWLIVCLSLGSLITNFTFIASSLRLSPVTTSTSP